MKTTITKVLLTASVLSVLPFSSPRVLAEPTTPTKPEKSAPPKPVALPVVHPTLLPDGVADAEGKIAYLRSPEGGVEAVEIATGKTKWTNKSIAKPLIALPDRLIAQIPVDGQENAVKITVWESASGKTLLLTKAVVFPDWVVVAAEDGMIYGNRLSIQPTLHGKVLSLSWQASTHYAGGAAPPPEVEAAARHNGSGVFKVDLKTGKVKSEIFSLEAEAEVGGEGETVIIGHLDKDADPETVTILGTKIFRVTSTQVEGGQAMPGEITRELNVAEIATGKLLWKRILKPRQIMALPM